MATYHVQMLSRIRFSLTLLYCGIDVCTQFTELLLPLEEKMAKQLHSEQDLSSECPRSDKLDTNWFPNYIHDVICVQRKGPSGHASLHRLQ